ncbi:MAG: tRNA pseudouridine(38-40) synthase TruA [Bacteroidales bacterium]|nr:tRNA pseudouridine(38-40) synthase TruA [Bacteroidales bacterium]
MRYFLKLAYNGANYHGWQSQPNAVSVQECIEKALSTILREPISIIGAGRTDAGVNAAVMYAHFDVSEPLKDMLTLVMRLNSILGKDIAIYDVLPVRADAHARFDAVSRTYKYFVHTEKSPFLYPFSWKSTCRLDFELMNEAAELLKNYRDFTSFSKLHTDVATNNCKITYARWEQEGEQWVFTITADRFLRNMVRAIVGTLVDVGRGKLTIEQFCEVIEKKDRCSAGTSMPGNALFLWNVKYTYID